MEFTTLGRYYLRFSEAYASVGAVVAPHLSEQLEFGYAGADEDGKVAGFDASLKAVWFSAHKPPTSPSITAAMFSPAMCGALALLADVFEDLARPENAHIQPAAFCALLEDHGFHNKLEVG